MVAKFIAPKLRFKVSTEDWQKSPINEITSYVDYRGKTPAKTDSGIFLVTAKNIRMGFIDYKSSEEFIAEVDYENVMSRGKPAIGDVLITTEAPMGNIASVDRVDIALAQRVIKLRGIKSVIGNGFLKYRLQSKQFQDELNSKSSGGTVKGIKGSVLHKMKVAFPVFEEQTKIANFLTAVDTKISQLTKKHQLLTLYKKGVMQKIFSQELRFKDDDGREFGEWKEMKFDDLGTIVTGKTPSTSDESLWNGDILFITPTDIGEEKYQICSARTVVKKEKMNVLPTHSIMFTCIASIGKMALSIKPCITNQQINSLIPSNSHYGEFIYYAILNMVDFIKSTQSTTTLPIINKTDFSKFLVDIPCYKEQTKIANFLTAIDDKITNVKSQLEAAKQYKQGLLQQMFV